MPSNVSPLPLVQRYAPGVPLALDLLSDLEAFQCGARSQREAPYTYQGKPSQSDPPGWDPAAVSPARFRHPRQLAALGCGYAVNFPFSHPERVQYFDRVRHDTAQVFVDDGGGQVFELVRAEAPRWGLAVIESVATYIRAQQFDGPNPVGLPFILGGNLVNFGGQPFDPNTITDPCPFPIPPLAINGTRAGLSIRFHLVNYQHSREVPDDPPFMRARREAEIPPHWITPPWEDMRYAWGSRYTDGHKWIVGGHSLIRLFAVVRVFGPAGPNDGYQLDFCTRLAGYQQHAGPYAAAQRGALWRV